MQRLYFTLERHNGQMGAFRSHDLGEQGSIPAGFAPLGLIFIVPSGISERFFCMFRRIHVRLPLACQVAFECFSFAPVPQTDLKHFNLTSLSLSFSLSLSLSPSSFLSLSLLSLSLSNLKSTVMMRCQMRLALHWQRASPIVRLREFHRAQCHRCSGDHRPRPLRRSRRPTAGRRLGAKKRRLSLFYGP